jgi:hypothetical protein
MAFKKTEDSMGKGKSFAAKVAHANSNEGKNICPTCNTDVKKLKLIKARESKGETWAPKYEMKDVCKCNESELLNGAV